MQQHHINCRNKLPPQSDLSGENHCDLPEISRGIIQPIMMVMNNLIS